MIEQDSKQGMIESIDSVKVDTGINNNIYIYLTKK